MSNPNNNQQSGIPADGQDNLMVHRTNTNLSDTLDSHSDVKKPITEKSTTTAIDIPACHDDKDEVFSSDCHEEEYVKKVSKFGLFYQRHLPWFQ